ncbi:hypothetical protein ABW20_dc0100771 [Dactylellina cionopaga]|nr:hypothetical protein ABW20_dc0100771 [Dactylellina cionopaga]
MSPSRGQLSLLLRFARPNRRAYSTSPPSPSPSDLSPPSLQKAAISLLKNSPHRLHIYRSTSTNPFFNLSAEDYLLRHSPATSTVLFTYKNAPSIVIGRNQNPWSEINFPLLNTPEYSHVRFVRRRSGGGTVYHDHGNLCWSVVMPRKVFDRDVNAHMVVRALHKLGVPNAAVNERHDIVLKPEKDETAGTNSSKNAVDKKVSGSAYKIIKDRAYHHATLLLDSKLEDIGQVLHSPLRPYITTKGVESVRSPVANIGVGMEKLVAAIETEFLLLNDPTSEEEVCRVSLDENETLKARQYIKEGMEELQSTKWLYTQTPHFILELPPQKPLPELPGLPGLTPVIPEHQRPQTRTSPSSNPKNPTSASYIPNSTDRISSK